LARINHVLIPAKKSDRDRLRARRIVRLVGLVFAGYRHLSREGRGLLLLSVPVGVAALDVRYSQVYFLFALLVGLLVGSWICRPLFRIRGLRLDVLTAPRISVGAIAHFQLELGNHGRAPLLNLRISPPFLPWDGRWAAPVEGVPLLEPGRHRRVKATAVFQARGEHHLDSFEVAQLVSTGLAVGPHHQSSGTRFLVVPRIANVVSTGLEASVPQLGQGLAAAVRIGETDIAGVRPYRIGDPLKHLHARTWARTGVPHVREYVDPRDQRVALVATTRGPGISEAEQEAALSLAAGVAARLALHGRGMDVLVCDEQVMAVEPRSGEAALDFVLDRLATLELTRDAQPALGAVAEVLSRCTSAVVVSAGADAELGTIVKRQREAGRPCSWAAIVARHDQPASEAAVRVTADAVVAAEAIAL
jgi:uncharacterized protein (DUF58 family)